MRNFRDVAQQAQALASERSKAQGEAARYDPDLTSEANARRRAERLAKIKAAFEPRFDALVREASARAEALKRDAARLRPRLDPSDAAALVRTEQVWAHNVRPFLEQGRSLSDVLQGASDDEVLAVERFAPAWLAQRQPRASRAELAQQVSGAIAQAFAATLTDGADVTVLDSEAADRDLTTLRTVVDYARQGRTLEAAMAAQYDS